MKFDKKGNIDFVHFPLKETAELIKVMKKAEKDKNLDGLRRCARLFGWLYSTMLEKDGTCGSDRGTLFYNGPDDMPIYSPSQFNKDWKRELKNPLPGNRQKGALK